MADEEKKLPPVVEDHKEEEEGCPWYGHPCHMDGCWGTREKSGMCSNCGN